MKPISSKLLLLCCLLHPTLGWAKLNVVATLPDFGSIARAIGGDNVNVSVLAKGTEDPHFVDARPSFVRVLNKADVLLEGGVELEIGWLPPLITAARNAKINTGAPGRVNLSEGTRLLEVPTTPVDRSMGDVHPLGNPHYNMDPANGKIIASHIADVFSKTDPKNASVYAANLNTFTQRLDAKLAEWSRLMEPLRGTPIVTYHKSFEYLAQRFGLEVVGQLEPRPGFEPSPTHINELIPKAKARSVKLLLIEPNKPRKTPQYVANALGIKLVIIPTLTEGAPEARDYIALFDYDLAKMRAAVNEPRIR